jgi:hypothetical protein
MKKNSEIAKAKLEEQEKIDNAIIKNKETAANEIQKADQDISNANIDLSKELGAAESEYDKAIAQEKFAIKKQLKI